MRRGITILIFALAAICFSQTVVVAQQEDHDAAVKAFKAGDYPTAIKALKRLVKTTPSDASAWELLGDCDLRAKKSQDAIKAYEAAVNLEPKNDQYHAALAFAHLIKRDSAARTVASETLVLNPNNADAHYILGVAGYRDGSYSLAYQQAKEVIRLAPDHAGAYRLKYEALLAIFAAESNVAKIPVVPLVNLLPEAAKDMETYLSLTTDAAARNDLVDELKVMKFFGQYYSLPENNIPYDPLSPPPVDPTRTPLAIVNKPKPEYSNAARSDMLSGTVLLLVAFLDDGTVGPILVVHSLGDGLDKEAIKAARQMEFHPELHKGVAVTVVKIVEYNFSIS